MINNENNSNCDCFAFGVLIYLLLFGRYPFKADKDKTNKDFLSKNNKFNKMNISKECKAIIIGLTNPLYNNRMSFGDKALLDWFDSKEKEETNNTKPDGEKQTPSFLKKEISESESKKIIITEETSKKKSESSKNVIFSGYSESNVKDTKNSSSSFKSSQLLMKLAELTENENEPTDEKKIPIFIQNEISNLDNKKSKNIEKKTDNKNIAENKLSELGDKKNIEDSIKKNSDNKIDNSQAESEKKLADNKKQKSNQNSKKDIQNLNKERNTLLKEDKKEELPIFLRNEINSDNYIGNFDDTIRNQNQNVSSTKVSENNMQSRKKTNQNSLKNIQYISNLGIETIHQKTTHILSEEFQNEQDGEKKQVPSFLQNEKFVSDNKKSRSEDTLKNRTENQKNLLSKCNSDNNQSRSMKTYQIVNSNIISSTYLDKQKFLSICSESTDNEIISKFTTPKTYSEIVRGNLFANRNYMNQFNAEKPKKLFAEKRRFSLCDIQKEYNPVKFEDLTDKKDTQIKVIQNDENNIKRNVDNKNNENEGEFKNKRIDSKLNKFHIKEPTNEIINNLIKKSSSNKNFANKMKITEETKSLEHNIENIDKEIQAKFKEKGNFNYYI